MRLIYELSWLGKILCITAVSSLLCIGCGMLICKARERVLRPRWIALIVIINFLIVATACIMLARTPMLIDMV